MPRHALRPTLLLALGAALAACADAPTGPGTEPPPGPPRTLGLVEITFNEVGTARMSAVVRPADGGAPFAGAQAAAVPVVGGMELGLRTAGAVDFGGERYLQAVFEVRNATADGAANGAALRNVTFVPVSTGSSLNGTPVKAMKKQDGSDADPALALQLRPTGAVADDGMSGLASQYPDVLQVFTEAEVAAIDLSGVAGVANRFPYGFVVRRAGSVATRELPASPAPGQYDGVVTFAFRIPRQASPADDPFTITVQVVAVQDDVTRITQSAEEQDAAGQAAFEARAAALGATQVTVLAGGGYGGALPLRLACATRTGGTAAAPTALLQPPAGAPAVGAAQAMAGPAGRAFCVEGGAAGAEYTLVPVNRSAAGAVSLSVRGDAIVPAVGPPAPARAGASPLRADARGEEDVEFHLALRRWERTALAPLMRSPTARVRRGAADDGRRLVVPGVPSVGDLWSLNVAAGCSGTLDTRTGRVVSVGARVVLVADTMNPAGGFTTAQYDSIAAEFDTLAWDVNVANFGAPTDLDGNGRVVAFYTRTVNELSPPASSVVVLGYVTARDLFSAAPGVCPLSNQGEMFYMLAPDPGGAVNGNVRSVSYVRGNTVGTLAHEFQHLINASRRLYVNGAPGFETVWLNEGLSHVAEELMFYRTAAGLAPRQNVDVAALTTGPAAPARVAAYNSYQGQNVGRLRTWLLQPEAAGPFRNDDALATRGAVWAFLRYAADRRNASDAALWFALVNSTTSGTANLQAALGVDPSAWLRDFATAMYADDAVAGAGAEHAQPSWDFRSLYGATFTGTYPLLESHLSDGAPLTLSYSPGGGSGYLRFGVPAGAVASVVVSSAGAAPPGTADFVLMRTR